MSEFLARSAIKNSKLGLSRTYILFEMHKRWRFIDILSVLNLSLMIL